MTARILVVDDIPANVKLLEVRLLAEYFDVLTAANGADALEMCENGKIDVVLLDVMMPDMDGFEVCRRLKSDAATSHISRWSWSPRSTRWRTAFAGWKRAPTISCPSR